ncbi:unnamed protein product, partial [Ixodes hexagonus]
YNRRPAVLRLDRTRDTIRRLFSSRSYSFEYTNLTCVLRYLSKPHAAMYNMAAVVYLQFKPIQTVTFVSCMRYSYSCWVNTDFNVSLANFVFDIACAA